MTVAYIPHDPALFVSSSISHGLAVEAVSNTSPSSFPPLSLRSDLSKIYQMPAVPAVLARFVRKGLPSFGWDPPHKVKR